MKYITLLRGINVGGNRKILMKDLIQLMEEIGGKEVKTYIQSGNIVFEADTLREQEWSTRIAKAISKQYGFEVAVITILAQELRHFLDHNPFASSDSKLLHGVFFSEIPDKEKIGNLPKSDSSTDEYHFYRNFMFLKCAGKYSDSKLTNNFLESKLKVSTTTRNWQTISKLLELAEVK